MMSRDFKKETKKQRSVRNVNINFGVRENLSLTTTGTVSKQCQFINSLITSVYSNTHKSVLSDSPVDVKVLVDLRPKTHIFRIPASPTAGHQEHLSFKNSSPGSPPRV